MNHTQDVKTLSDKLIAYLRAELGDPALDFACPLAQLQGGYETWTYRFELDGATGDLSGPLVLRLYPPFYGTRNAVWESIVQNVLAKEGYPVARAYVVCTDMSILGGAFFIMAHLPGQLLGTVHSETMPDLLGKTHAELHRIDPGPLIETLKKQGIDEYEYGLSGRFGWLDNRANKLPWIRPVVDWLLDHRPPDPERLAVCHGDFHAFNILFGEGKVTGVLDWPGFAIADPVFDVANTMVLITIPYKRLAASMSEFSSVDWDLVAERYLDAYRARTPLDGTNLNYYRVRRCVSALVEGAEGQKIWQHPLIVQDLLAFILDVSGIRIAMPD